MKSSTLLVLLVLIASCFQVAGKSLDTFVIIGKETYFCDKVQVGRGYTRIYIEGRLFFKVPSFVVNAYAEKGSFYEYLPVVNKDQDTTGWAFMHFIASRGGKRLYRYCSNCLKYDPIDGEIAPSQPVYRYYTFESGKFVSVTDNGNIEDQLALFGVKVIS
jgi:hypothetical protein